MITVQSSLQVYSINTEDEQVVMEVKPEFTTAAALLPVLGSRQV